MDTLQLDTLQLDTLQLDTLQLDILQVNTLQFDTLHLGLIIDATSFKLLHGSCRLHFIVHFDEFHRVSGITI